MKQAAEQLNQGTITKAQYNKLIQEVLHMSEDQKLRAAQRKERESKIWDRNDKGPRPKEHGMHPRPPGKLFVSINYRACDVVLSKIIRNHHSVNS